MKLLMTTGIFPPDIGGPATYVPTMAEALMARGALVTVLTLSGDSSHDDGRYPFRVVRLLRRSLSIRRMVQVIARIAALARRHDLVFAPGLPVETALAARLVGKPYVLKVVGDLAWERAMVRGRVSDGIEAFQVRRYGPWIEFHRRAQMWAARGAARVVVPSAYLRRIVSGWGVEEPQIEVIPNAAPACTGLAPKPVSDGRAMLGEVQRFRVVTVARLVPWKGVEQVIRGMAMLDGVDVLVLGDGPERSRLEALAAVVQCQARFLGQLPHPEVLEIIRSADLLILNSAYEGHPHVILEAMASGVPVVARAAGGTPELVRHRESGLLLQTGTETEVVAAVREIMEDPGLRARLGQAGRASVADFTLDQIADRTWQVLEDVLAASRRVGVGLRRERDARQEARGTSLIGGKSHDSKL